MRGKERGGGRKGVKEREGGRGKQKDRQTNGKQLTQPTPRVFTHAFGLRVTLINLD